jgi:hypothetical protein
MAFTRSYATESAGDPFRLRAPKFIRKLTMRKIAPKFVQQAVRKLTVKNIVKGARKFAPYAAGAAALAVPGLAPTLAGWAAAGSRMRDALAAGPTSEPTGPEPPSYGAPGVYTSPEYEMEVRSPRAPQYYEPDDEQEDPEMYDDDYDEWEGDPDELAAEFARGYGYDMGDPGRRRKAPRGSSTLNKAGAPPSVKASGRKKTRAKKVARAAGAAARKATQKPKGKGPRIDWGRLAEAAASGVPVAGGLIEEGLRQARGAGAAKVNGAALGFGRSSRRTMNPANVRALRRSLRRVEGFEKLVKRVEKMYPRMRRAHGSAAAPRGHKRGCKCATCR